MNKYKYLILLFSSLLLMGDYFAYDIPAIIQNDLGKKFPDLDKELLEEKIDILYSIYTIPNLFLPLLCSIITKKVYFLCL